MTRGFGTGIIEAATLPQGHHHARQGERPVRKARRLTDKQYDYATDALRHVIADWEEWASCSDPSAKDLDRGIKVLAMLLEDRKPRSMIGKLKEEA